MCGGDVAAVGVDVDGAAAVAVAADVAAAGIDQHLAASAFGPCFVDRGFGVFAKEKYLALSAYPYCQETAGQAGNSPTEIGKCLVSFLSLGTDLEALRGLRMTG